MDKIADSSGENKEDNVDKPFHHFIVPDDSSLSLIDFPPYELPLYEISQSSNEFDSLVVESDHHREEPEVHMHELVDWNDSFAIKVEELLLSNLQAVFKDAIEQIVELGYSEDVAEKALSRKAIYIQEGDPVSNIVNDTLNVLKGKYVATPDVLKGKDIATLDVIFENFQHMLYYTMLEMITVLREVRPSLTIGEAMWVLLMSDLNVSLACSVEDCLNVVFNGDSYISHSFTQSKSEVQRSDIISNYSSPTSHDSSPTYKKCKSEAPPLGKLQNSPNDKSYFASEVVKPHEENASLPTPTGKPPGTSGGDCKVGHCSKRHNRKEIAALRQKFLHMEKVYRARGKGGLKTGKFTSVGGLMIDKRIKPPYDIHNQQMKGDSSNTTSKQGVCASDAMCHVSTNDASILPIGSSSKTLSDTTSSPIEKPNISASETMSKPKSEPSFFDAQHILDECVGIPYDESLGMYVPRDQKDEIILKLVPRVNLLQGELQSWSSWTNQKVMQVTTRLGRLQPELKMLKNEKQEAEIDAKLFQENIVNRISEMENTMENTKKQIENTTSIAFMRDAENTLLKNELDAAKLSFQESMISHQQALEREHIALQKLESLDRENALHRDELEREKHKLSNLRQQLDKEKTLLVKVEGRLEKEITEIENILKQSASIIEERKQLAENIKVEEDKIIKKAAGNLQKYVEVIANLETHLEDLKQKSESEKIAALRKGKPMGSKQWGSSQTMVSCQSKSATGSLRREHECVMCLSEEISVVFLPCAHQVVCAECNELHEKQGMKDCPSCRAPIQQRIHAKFAWQ
ncbi:hypothetical protein TanjilG_24625 [Lupinus angustifolius]|uniref:RING-type domain-containing protein n=1 Tax=Lupinus angustifolius TaxID=3871 RepID=A0A4P1RKV3_LUPAN|nr:PREDICTED: putative E3 ubiquitin-protein ligase RF298 [Lupinus angustifolius]XP_019441815.1 PREDICTED: putative E3 ubiquitin-protein ligase RF298 [Lupinus angustifolius]OIW12692.1 hypothetical protein TanjilG_24625 [Lupinus angustifolius]